MRDSKSSLLIALSLLLLSFSLIFLFIWGYNTYIGAQNLKTEILKNKDIANTVTSNKMRDSLLKIYEATIDKLDSRIDSTKISADSLLDNVDNKLIEINKLKVEISSILKNKSSLADLGTARQKIDELQVKVAQLRNHNLSIEKENKRLNALVQQLILDKNNGGQNNNIDQNTYQPATGDKPLNSKAVLNTIFIITDIRLAAFVVKGDEEEEILQGDETEKLNGSFTVKNNNYPNNTADMVVVVMQPNGKVLQNSTWQTGTFDTQEGKKIYSVKLHFDFTKGEEKQLQFSLSTDKFLKGNYIVQIYYNGSIIGKMVKFLP